VGFNPANPVGTIVSTGSVQCRSEGFGAVEQSRRLLRSDEGRRMPWILARMDGVIDKPI
jgi:hypothetical protein